MITKEVEEVVKSNSLVGENTGVMLLNEFSDPFGSVPRNPRLENDFEDLKS